MNSFDAAIYIGLIVAMIAGFKAGLLRSGVTILAYLIAMPLSVWVVSMLCHGMGIEFETWLAKNSPFFFGVFLVIGVALGKMMRMLLDDAIGSEAGIGDRLAGALLGIARVGLVAITLVLVFDQLVPSYRQPPFLTGSQLRPWLSALGQRGFRSLPSDVTTMIDRIKRDRQI
jgi:membrane protein required for colicin V production